MKRPCGIALFLITTFIVTTQGQTLVAQTEDVRPGSILPASLSSLEDIVARILAEVELADDTKLRWLQRINDTANGKLSMEVQELAREDVKPLLQKLQAYNSGWLCCA